SPTDTFPLSLHVALPISAELVYKALSSISRPLHLIETFHTDRGSEFKNQLIDDALETFGIQRSLSMKGCPYDNAVAEAMFKVVRSEEHTSELQSRFDLVC